MSSKCVLYVQYANPAAYPPLQHSSRILADAGCEVLILGLRGGSTAALKFPKHPRIDIRVMADAEPGITQKLHYFLYFLWVIWTAATWRPQWIYASDSLATPAALCLRLFGWPVVYHEHDTPAGFHDGQQLPSGFMRIVLWTRRHLIRRASLVVLPNQTRAERLTTQTGTKRPVYRVWNCPSLAEVEESTSDKRKFVVYYHGGISSELLPLNLITALALVEGVDLIAIGYSTKGTESHRQTLKNAAIANGVESRVTILPAMSRHGLLQHARAATVGWAAMPMKSGNHNFQAMPGASNKVFDYLACALPVIVSDLPEWKEMFVTTGYGLPCNPESAESIAEILCWFVDHEEKRRLMGEAGRQRILAEWNYEKQFDPILKRMTGP